MKKIILFCGHKTTNKKSMVEISTVRSNDQLELIELIGNIQTEMLNYMVLIDKDNYKCLIYKASGSITEIKKNLLPQIDVVFLELTGEDLFISKFIDLRYKQNVIQKHPILN